MGSFFCCNICFHSAVTPLEDTMCTAKEPYATYRGQSRALVDGVVSLLALVRLAVAADASHAVHAALVGAARAVIEADA